MRSLEYVPYPDLYGRPHVFVDGLRAPGTVLELSHWPGNRTPHRLKDDVSTQSVLRLLALADHERDSLLGGASAVTCDHYDVDGLLSVLCLTRPEFALRHRSLLAAVAVCGDFDVYTGDAAVQVCLALLAAERAVFTRIAPVSVDQAAAALFRGDAGRRRGLRAAAGCVAVRVGGRVEPDHAVGRLSRRPPRGTH